MPSAKTADKLPRGARELLKPGTAVCSPKVLDRKLLIPSAKTAVAENPSNCPAVRGLNRLVASINCDVPQPQAIAMLTDKYWGVGGVDLSVGFMETTTTELQNLIISHMNAWGDYGNVRFRPGAKSTADVRISRGPGGYWSYLGTDIRHIPSGQQTMNLEGFTLKTPLSEYKRVVRHETGHTLGFPHEHMRPEIVALLDENKTIAYFLRYQGWSEGETRQQVLTPLDPGEIVATAPDVQSIMCYQFPGACTKNGSPIPGGLDIDATDGQFCGQRYPKTVTPVQPPPAVAGAIRIDMGGKKLYVPDSSWTLTVGG